MRALNDICTIYKAPMTGQLLKSTTRQSDIQNNTNMKMETNSHSPAFRLNITSQSKESNSSKDELNHNIIAGCKGVNKKLTQAMSLMSNMTLNISEIAYIAGFNDPKYFSRCFKRMYGATPKEYREAKFKRAKEANEMEVDEKFITQVANIIQDNISTPHFGVNELAEALNISYSTLYRKFKSISVATPYDFIRNARIRNALEMISQGQHSISEITFASGFCSFSYLNRCLNSEMGFLPPEIQEIIVQTSH